MARSKSLFFVFVGLLIHTATVAQQNRYMVFFKDKAGSAYSVEAPDQFLSQKAIARRIQQNITVTEQDLPVNAHYVQGVRDVGTSAFFKTRWLNGVLVQCDASLTPALEALSFVDRVEMVAPNASLMANGRSKRNMRLKTEKATEEVTDTQLTMLGLTDMQKAGYRGEALTIAIFDSGFSGVDATLPFAEVRNENRIMLTTDFVYNDDNVYQYDEHGTEVFSVIAAYQSGVFTGGAYEATYQLYVTEEVPTEYRIEEYNWLFAAEKADSAGADIISASLGYYDFDLASMNYTKAAMDGKTTVVSRAAQLAADRGIVVVCSAGNEGNLSWQIITAPADARDVLAVGSVNSSGQRSPSSSIGPTADARTKPDVVALGVSTSVVKPNGTIGTASGTSLATPLITSLVAGVWQKYPHLSNKEIIHAIRQAGSQAANPDNLLGYGIPNFKTVVDRLGQQVNLFDVYPNPITSDTVIIEPKDPGDASRCFLQVLSILGQTVYEGEINFSSVNRKYHANLSHLKGGTYFMRIFWNQQKFTYKLIMP